MKNNIKQPVILVGSAIFLLLILSVCKIPGIGYLNSQQNIDILADIKSEKAVPKLDTSTITNDSTFTNTVLLPTDLTLIADYGINSAYPLTTFFNKLNASKQLHKKVRIAYFGDSFIESDNITDELRRKLQLLYGGNGIGFLPIQSAVSAQYRNINFFTKGIWEDYNFKNNPYKLPLGLTGHVFYASGNTTTEFIAKNQDVFNNVQLYTGFYKPLTSKIYVAKDGKETFLTIKNSSLVNETTLNTGMPLKDIRIASTDAYLPIYGISIEGKEGVYLDNYSFRGNNSTLTNQISKTTMQAFNKYLQYDLIILHYGINAVEHDKQKSPWFESSMTKLIETIKQGFPNTPILLISTSDFARRYNGKYMTENAVPFMVDTQRKIAMQNGVAFWDLYDAMGGQNTMVHWVEGDTVLAYKDYIHVNEKGAKKIAGLFFDKLLSSKKYYEQSAKK